MTDLKTQRKWDSAASLFDVMGGFGPERRWREAKTRLFSRMDGRILFLIPWPRVTVIGTTDLDASPADPVRARTNRRLAALAK